MEGLEEMLEVTPAGLALRTDRSGNVSDAGDAPAGWRKLYGPADGRSGFPQDDRIRWLKASCLSLRVPFAPLAFYHRHGSGRYVGWETEIRGIVVPDESAEMVAKVADLLAADRIEWFDGKPRSKDKRLKIVFVEEE